MAVGGASVYILLCADGSYYTGLTRKDVETRVSEHNQAINADYTSRRRPVKLIWSAHFERLTDAIATERRLKGWSRVKKEAMMRGEFEALPGLAARRTKHKQSRLEESTIGRRALLHPEECFGEATGRHADDLCERRSALATGSCKEPD